MTCRICLDRKAPFYRSECLSICRACIQLLNSSYLPIGKVDQILDGYLRSRLTRWDAATLTNHTEREQWQIDAALQRQESPMEFERHFRDQRSKWLNDLAANKGASRLSRQEQIALQFLRAYRRQILRASLERNATYPEDWPFRAAKVRERDDNKCCRCKNTWSIGAIDLHVHHIIHKSNGGSHNPKNLVTLCHVCHNKEHPEQDFQPVAQRAESLEPLFTSDSTNASSRPSGLPSSDITFANKQAEVTNRSPGIEPRNKQTAIPELLRSEVGADSKIQSHTYPVYGEQVVFSDPTPTHPIDSPPQLRATRKRNELLRALGVFFLLIFAAFLLGMLFSS